ncbi:MAG: peptidoglycan-binding protein [Methylococcales bacterium]|nr:peptidoglycan-binding protein [Methylococcales bacterium]
MAFLKKLTGLAGLLLSLTVIAGEDPDLKTKKNTKKNTNASTGNLSKQSSKSLTPRNVYRRELKLYPRTRIEDIEEALKKIPADAIMQFLSTPKVVNDDEINAAPYVIDFAGEHLIGGAGTRVYVRSILTPTTLDYAVYRKGDAYINPDTKELLGYEALYIASATLQREGDPATLMITKSTQEVRRGDRLMEATKRPSELNYFPEYPKKIIKGTIISVLDGVSQIGKYNIVVIDKGTVDGLKVGHVLDIYQRGRLITDTINQERDDSVVQLPDELAGALMIFRNFKRVSYALILRATQAIHILDKIKTPVDDSLD